MAKKEVCDGCEEQEPEFKDKRTNQVFCDECSEDELLAYFNEHFEKYKSVTD